MGGNNTFAAGKIAAYRWKTVGKIDGVKILELKDEGLSRKLPEEAHSSRMYILQHPNDGTFSQFRVYDHFHRLRFEVGFHPESRLDSSGKSVLHYHVYTYPSGSSHFERTEARHLTEKMRKKFGKFMKGVL